ncbi:ABC transporter substrate-binding protein [Bifidobacterium simiarum]|uniref:ABC transporter substrate-binding protein n=1 Tax=Bifidobacterium simiarum TaxID=2045441 RepID=A0A2M9HDM1_9BIFI|nr:ABC transporter substrate-binding protein [Bifidobacterium simiarum]PJM74913.1 ABC transporter substrate-binding protein [Bifidobacterium simiarum]
MRSVPEPNRPVTPDAGAADPASADVMTPATPPMSRRQAREARAARRQLQHGGIKAIAVFLVSLLILGTCGRVVYGMIIDHRAPLDLGGFNAGGSVTIGVVGAPSSLDIRKAGTATDGTATTGGTNGINTDSGSTAVQQALLGNVYESLLSLDEHNTAQPGVADSYAVSGDGLTYTFTINAGKTFSNGDALDADDVVWSLQQTIGNHYAQADRLTGLKSVKADGANTVTVALSQPNPDLPWLLAGPTGIVYDKDAKYSYDTTAIGSGPFTVQSWENGTSLTLKANGRYWGQKAKTGTVTLKYYGDDTAAVAALGRGDVDAITPVAESQRTALSRIDGVSVRQGDSTHRIVLGFNNGTDSILSDKRYRQGIRYAIDRTALANALVGGSGGRTLGGPFTPLEPGYEDLNALFPHSSEKATDLLAYFFYVSHRRTLTFVYPSRYGTQVGELLKQQLQPMNVDLDVKAVDDATWRQTVQEKKQYDFTLFDMDDSHDLATLMDSGNFIGYESPAAQALWASAQKAGTASAYETAMKRLARQISDDSPLDWLCERRPLTAQRGGVTGLPATMTDRRLPLADVTKG